MKEVEVRVPSVGESITRGFLNRWSVRNASTVIEGQAICELETDKTTIDITAPATGILRITVSEETEVEINQVIGTIDASGTDSQKGEYDTQTEQASLSEVKKERMAQRISPSAKAEIARSGIEMNNISGSGRDKLINKSDVIASISSDDLADAHDVPAVQDKQVEKSQLSITSKPIPGQIEKKDNSVAVSSGEHRKPLSRIRRLIAANLAKTKSELVLLTTFNEADMSAIKIIRGRYKDAFQEKHGVKLGFMSFFLKASAVALASFPELNAYIDGNEVVYRDFINISVAVSTPRGLVTPVVRNVQTKGFGEIEREIASFSVRASNKTLIPEDLIGGSFAISNGGVFGSLLSTPLPAPKQTAILGMHSIIDRPVAIDNAVHICPMMYLALSYDHRLIDGKEAVSFLRKIKEGIENPERLLLDI